MRRTDKDVADRGEIDGIISACTVCRLGFCRENVPYVVPLCFGYDGAAVYFHTAREGRKIEFLEAGNPVCFEFECEVEVLAHETRPCSWSMAFESVIGNGRVEELVREPEKIAGLELIMSRYSDRKWDLNGVGLGNVRVWKIFIESITGKRTKR